MSAVTVPQREIQRAALEHDIRTAQTQNELLQSHKKSASLDTYRAELLNKVHDHLEELEHLEESKVRTAHFKAELLAKVHEHMDELERGNAKKEEVARIKAELMEKVHRHAEELEQMDAKRADLATYKSELLAKAEEHVRDVKLAHEKEAQVRRFSLEMKEKVKEHEAHLVERENATHSLMTDIIQKARSYYGGIGTDA
jgi:chromosome segregation ATPase